MKDKLSFSKIIENKTPKTGSNARNIPLLFVSVSDNPLFQVQFANKLQPIPQYSNAIIEEYEKLIFQSFTNNNIKGKPINVPNCNDNAV